MARMRRGRKTFLVGRIGGFLFNWGGGGRGGDGQILSAHYVSKGNMVSEIG